MSETSRQHHSIETFEVAGSTWQTMSNNLNTKRANQTTTVGLDGELYIIGGFDGSHMLSSYESVYFTGSTDNQTPNAGNPSKPKTSTWPWTIPRTAAWWRPDGPSW